MTDVEEGPEDCASKTLQKTRNKDCSVCAVIEPATNGGQRSSSLFLVITEFVSALHQVFTEQKKKKKTQHKLESRRVKNNKKSAARP